MHVSLKGSCRFCYCLLFAVEGFVRGSNLKPGLGLIQSCELRILRLRILCSHVRRQVEICGSSGLVFGFRVKGLQFHTQGMGKISDAHSTSNFSDNIGGLTFRIGFWGILYCTYYRKEPPKFYSNS